MPRALLLFALLTLSMPLRAQRSEASLSEGEIEQIRESAYIANDRILVFIKLLDVRIKSLQDLYAKPRRPGREQDTHDLLEQFTALADELNDNLDDFGPRHRDIRKALPKLVDALERWATAVKTPPENETYNVQRRLALETIHDLHDEATQMIDEQKTWFAAHPPQKENPANADAAPR
jgi:ABC-type transporter Mla subunit MlaD